MEIKLVDAVVCNFYPFQDVARLAGQADSQLVESIDIGGPTMVRGASKNFERVAVVPSPKYYPLVVEELKRTGGGTTLEFRRRLALEAFSLTSSYYASIFNALLRLALEGIPETFLLSGSKFMEMKYGDKPDIKT